MNPHIALIGCGVWGKNHARELRSMGVLRWIWDDDPKVRAWIEENYPATLAPLEHIWQDPEVKGVVIATPPTTHFRIAYHAATNGKAMLIEKPMVLRKDDAAGLIHYASDQGSLLMVGHLMRYHPGFIALQQIVQSGKIGTVEYVYSNRLQPGRIRVEENSLWSLAPHDISMITALVGMPKEVYCTGNTFRGQQPDIVTATFGFENGIRGHLFISWLHPQKERILAAIGNKGACEFREGIGWWSVSLDGKIIHGGSGHNPLRAELEHFVECIETGKKPLTDSEDGLRVVQVLSACQQSMDRRGIM